MAAVLTHPAPSRGEAGSGPDVLVDLSAIDEAIASRRLGLEAAGLEPASQAARPPAPAADRFARGPSASPLRVASPEWPSPAAPRPGSAAFHALFPPPPPVSAAEPPARPGSPHAGDAGASPAEPWTRAVADLPAARPAVSPGGRFATPRPRRLALQPASALVRPVPPAAPRAVLARLPLAPVAKPARPRDVEQFARGVRLRLPYPVSATELSPSAQAELEALVGEVGGNDRLRLRLAAYANAGAGSAARARRTSLTRALAVRSFLIERGIKAGRIDLRAFGNMTGAAEADRVDVVVGDK
jgi:outer membrane protein OmpA-like peptidoglycan-associated protein